MSMVAYQFEGFELVPSQRALRRDGRDLTITPRAFDLLVALVGRAGQVVSKNDLLTLVWPKVIVEENNLQVHVSALRKLLGPHAIATIPGRGYSFTLLPSAPASPSQAPSGSAASNRLRNGNLPVRGPQLYGRDGDISAVEQLLRESRIVSIVGPAGIGKTSLGRAVAHASQSRHADGAWFVELAELVEPGKVAGTIARVLGQPIASQDAAIEPLVDALRDSQLLLVLDNCEHLISAVADVTARILDRAPGVHLLLTSQEPIHVLEERLHRLGPLAVPEAPDSEDAMTCSAVELFAARARAADPRLTVGSANIEAVVDVCRQLDGIPLAIELAAARAPLLGMNGLRQRLDERLKLLAGNTRNALPRHRTLMAALQWSHSLLSPHERTVFDRLGVFVGSFSLQAAQHVASDESIDAWAVLDHLAALVDKSLVLVEGDDPPRYRLLESSRAFALERLAQDGAMQQLRRRHAEAIADTLAGNDPAEGPTRRMRRIAPDLENMRAAVAWATDTTGDRQVAIKLAVGSHLLWEAQGCNDEGARLYRLVEPWVDHSTPPLVVARFWLAIAGQPMQVDIAYKADAARKAVGLLRGVGLELWLFESLASLAYLLSLIGDERGARSALNEMQVLMRSSWPYWTQLCLECGRGHLEFYATQDLTKARQHHQAVVDLARNAGEPECWADWSAWFVLLTDYVAGEWDDVVRRATDLLNQPDLSAGATMRAEVFTLLGSALAGLGRLDEAAQVLPMGVKMIGQAFASAEWAMPHVAFWFACAGRMHDAARIVGFVEPILNKKINAVPAYRRAYNLARSAAMAALGASEFDRLIEEGGRLSEEMAVELALSMRQRQSGGKVMSRMLSC